MSEFDTNEKDEKNTEQGSVYSYRYSDINQGENDTTTSGSSSYQSTDANQQQANQSYAQQSNQSNTSNAQQHGYSYQNPYGANGGYTGYGSSTQQSSRTQSETKHRRVKHTGRVSGFFVKGNFGNKLLKVVAIALVFGLVSGSVFGGVTYLIAQKTGTDAGTSNTATLSTSDSLSSTAISTATTVTDVSDIVSNVMPSIVAVTNISYTEYRSLFGGMSTRESQSAGSGIIVSQDNDYLYIATNNHVVSGAETLTITFSDETAAPATVKGTDSSVDLAVVAVALSDIEDSTLDTIKVATLGDSSSVSVGESAVVIGNALGYGQSVTTGVVSALEREVTLEDDSGNTITSTLMQTDAAVNPGNSGGALLNMNGEVIGIVSAKYSDTSVEGMGYAIPISMARDIIETIISQEVVTEDEAAYFGIAGVDVESDVSSQYGMPTGVYVTKVAENSGAGKAGIQKGDIIVSFNGRSVSSMEEISNIMQYLKAGTTVEVVVAQAANNYEETTLSVTLTNKN